VATLMAFATAESLIDRRKLDPQDMAMRLFAYYSGADGMKQHFSQEFAKVVSLQGG